MDIKELADGLAAKFGIGDIVVENGEVALDIDGMLVLLSGDNGSAIVITGLVGDPPADGGEAFANVLLEGTMDLMHTKSVALARNSDTGAYALVQRVEQDGLTLDAFSEALDDFVNNLETWRTLLENFRPAATAAKAAYADELANDKGLAMGGFMQV